MKRPVPPRAKKSLGQNFLIDPNLQRKIVDALGVAAHDCVVEVGPGTGALTRHLVGAVRRLVLVELDDRLAARLAEEYAGHDGVEVIHGDVLRMSVDRLAGDRDVKVVGNIPYSITTPLIFHLLDARPRPLRIVLTVQREVAERLLAGPGTKRYGALTVGVQAVARVTRLFLLSRNVFRPRPDVDSMAVRIDPIVPPPLTPEGEAALRRLTRAAFSRRRKQLQKVLRQATEFSLAGAAVDAALERLAIDPATRPDALPVADYIRLALALSGDPD